MYKFKTINYAKALQNSSSYHPTYQLFIHFTLTVGISVFFYSYIIHFRVIFIQEKYDQFHSLLNSNYKFTYIIA